MTETVSAADPLPDRIGPILYARGGDGRRDHLAAILVLDEAAEAPELFAAGEATQPIALATRFGRTVWRYDFSLPAGTASSYRIDETDYAVVSPDGGAARIAYVSCNGQENGDLTRDIAERDAMWTRLTAEHECAPFSLMLQGGDQLYADDVLACHPDVQRWATLKPDARGTVPLTDAARAAIRRFYFERYLISFARPAMGAMSPHVPSVSMWDDHDIIDGWGSHPAALLDSPVGRGLFEAAREMFLIFQLAADEADLPAIALDRQARSLGVAVRYPGLTILAPDLRSERRPDRVMGPVGWKSFETALEATPEPDRIVLMSSVPVLGPRLSWAELVAGIVPRVAKLSDDLRDQWQSRAHRREWIRCLQCLADRAERAVGGLVVVSGEIHLATRGEMRLLNGSVMHQHVASGISHPAPGPAYPFALGLLARVGESPLRGRKIRLRPLPSRRATYTSERNYLVLSQDGMDWQAEWELEDSGRTPKLAV